MNVRRPTRLSHVACAAALALGLLALIAPLAGQPSPLTLLSKEGRRPLNVAVAGGQEMLALDDLASVFQLTVREEAGAITVSYRGRTIVLTPEQALASVAGRLVSLPAPVVRGGGRWLVPLEFISRALAPVYDTRLELRRASRLVIVGDVRVPRVTVRHEALAASTRLTIEATPRAANTIAQEPGRLLIRFEADALDLQLPTFQSQGLAAGLGTTDAITLAVELGPRFGSYRASTETADNTSRLVLDLIPASTETTTAAAAPAPPPAGDPPAELPLFGQPTTAIRTVVIDPGHGGDDVGARGASGAEEKDITLSVARRLRGALEGRLGIRVLLTRDDDRAVPTEQRTALANNNKADVLISLHANASLRPVASGASIYVATFADVDEEQTPPTPERVPVFGGGSRDIELVLWDFAQTRFIEQSAALASILERQFQGRVPVNAVATDRAPFRVLEAANMPAVLIEMGYLTNPEQEQQLTSSEFQGTLAQAVFDAIVEFRSVLAEARAR